MRRKLAALLLACLPAFAVGTVTQSVSAVGPQPSTGPDLRVYVLQITWVADAANGSVPATLLNSIVGNSAMQGMRISSVEIQPGSPSPTAGYAITLTDSTGADMLAGTGANLSASAASFSSSVVSPPLVGLPTFNLSGNSVNSAQGKVTIYFVPLSMMANARGLPAALGTNNTFTGTNTYSNTVTHTGTLTAANFNNIRIVDGIKFPQTAAGINAADADLGAGNPGEIWVPSGSTINASDAQISITQNHLLKIFGRINIEAAVPKGPILLGSGAGITCSVLNSNAGTIGEITPSATVTSMIRLAVQDGSQTNNFIQGCDIAANASTVANGVIDASGMTGTNGNSWIRDNYINNFASGWGIFIQDIQTGALSGTFGVEIQNNKINAFTGTGGCIELTHSAANPAGLANLAIQDTTCTPGPSIATAPVLLVNANTSSGLLAKITVTNMNISGTPAAQPNLTVNGVGSLSIRQLICSSGSVCLNIPNATQNLAVVADSVFCFSCTNTLVDTANSVTISNISVGHYDLPVPNIPTYSGTYNTIYKATIANLNNIRIVDGVKFAKSAAGINAADADLGAGTAGDIWVTGNVTATDAQVSITANHTLRVMGTLTVNANANGPILLGSSAAIVCSAPYGTSGNILEGTANITSLVRLAVQDGSQDGIVIDGCELSGGSGTVTNGVIDATGARGRAYIRNTLINNFTSGWGIFIQDIQSGALAGTNSVQIINSQIGGSNTAGCIEITHSSTVAVSLNTFDIQEVNCTGGASLTTAPIVITDLSGNGLLRQVNIANVVINSTPSSQPGMTFNNVTQIAAKSISCFSGNPCVKLTGGAATSNLLDNIYVFNGFNTLNDANNSVTIGGPALYHYEEPTLNTNFSFLPNVSYLKVNGLTPASCTSTGTGTGPTCAFDAGSTNNTGVISITTGTTPSSSGTVTLNFNTTQTNFGQHNPACVFNLSNFGASWNARATVISNATSTTSFIVNWDNNAVNLTASSGYFLTYWCAAK